MEHRWGRRVRVDIPIRIQTVESLEFRPAKLLNVSLTGALLAADFTLRPLSRVQIVIESNGLSHSCFMGIAAYVAVVHPHGIGIEWYDLANPTVSNWLRLAQELRVPVLSVSAEIVLSA